MAAYDITQIDNLTVDAGGSNNEFSVIKLDDTHFAVVYGGSGADGYIKTYSVDSNYDNITELDSLEHDTSQGERVSAVLLDSTHFVIAYTGVGTDGFIKTFSFNGSYEVTQIDSLEHDTGDSYGSSLMKIDDTHVALAYRSGSVNRVKTFTIDGSYNISQTDNYTDSTGASTGRQGIIQVDATRFLVACANTSDGTGRVKLFTLNGSYVLTKTTDLSYNFGGGYAPDFSALTKLTDTRYILASKGFAGSQKQVIRVVSLSGSTLSILSTTDIFSGTIGDEAGWLLRLGDDHFMYAVGGDGGDGYVITYELNGDDTITAIDTLEQDTSQGVQNTAALLNDDHFVLGYFNGSFGTVAKTFSIELPAGFTASPMLHQMAQAGGLL